MPPQQTSGTGQQTCEVCGEPFRGRQSRQRFCSPTCRSRGHRGTVIVQQPEPPTSDEAPAEQTGLVAAVKSELETAGRLDTMLGQSALLLAEQMCSNRVALGSAALNKELRATMAEALQGATVAKDALDEVKRKRDEIRRRRAG